MIHDHLTLFTVVNITTVNKMDQDHALAASTGTGA